MKKNEAKTLVIEWTGRGIDLSGLSMPPETISYFTLQFIDWLYKNNYKIKEVKAEQVT